MDYIIDNVYPYLFSLKLVQILSLQTQTLSQHSKTQIWYLILKTTTGEMTLFKILNKN